MSPPFPVGDGERERLVEAARLAGIGRIVPSVAHQLSTPLAAIALRAESLDRAVEALDESEVSEKLHRHLKAIHEEAFRCKEILSTLQIFTRPPDGVENQVDLTAVCREVRLLVHHEAMRRQVQVEMRLAEPSAIVRGDESRLRQLVLALVANALLASPEQGVVVLETSVEGRWTTLTVSDQGPGVPESVANRIFEPFVSTRPPSSGAGLGLTACQAIAAAHDGTLSWVPTEKGGVRFTLTLESGPR